MQGDVGRGCATKGVGHVQPRGSGICNQGGRGCATKGVGDVQPCKGGRGCATKGVGDVQPCKGGRGCATMQGGCGSGMCNQGGRRCATKGEGMANVHAINSGLSISDLQNSQC